MSPACTIFCRDGTYISRCLHGILQGSIIGPVQFKLAIARSTPND